MQKDIPGLYCSLPGMQVPSFDGFLLERPVFRHEEAEAFLVATGICKEGRAVQTYLVNRTASPENPQGNIRRIRRGLYVAAKAPIIASLWPDPLLVAWRAYAANPELSSDRSNGVIGFQSALHFWARMRPPRVIRVFSPGTRRDEWSSLEIQGVSFAATAHRERHVHPRLDYGAVEVSHLGQSILVTSPEQTLVDTLDRIEFLESGKDHLLLLHALSRLPLALAEVGRPPLDLHAVAEHLAALKRKGTVAARLGFILQHFQEEWAVPDSFLDQLRAYIPSTRGSRYWKKPKASQDESISDSRRGLLSLLGDWGLTVPDAFLIKGTVELSKPTHSDQYSTTETPVRKTLALADAPILDQTISIQSFTSATTINLRSELISFGYPEGKFREGQEKCIRWVLEGRDALGILPTGGGKSLIYQLPTAIRKRYGINGLTLVISPLVALMEDQVLRAVQKGLSARAVHGGHTKEVKDDTFARAMSGDLDLLFLSPESMFLVVHRMARHLHRIKLLVVDEAHCVSQWGHDFRPKYGRIGKLRDVLHDVPILALTATATKRTEEDIRKCLQITEETTHRGSVVRDNLMLKIMEPIHKFEKRISTKRLDKLKWFVKDKVGRFGIVYCHRKSDTYKVSDFLNKHGHVAKPFHGKMSPQEKMEIQQAFLTGECNVIASTIAFGMGIDKPDVRFVAHLRLPASLEGYVQEIGRAGRDGGHADCALIYSVHDAPFHTSANKRKSGIHGQAANEALDAMIRLVNEKECLHQQIASYFGESTLSCSDSPAEKRKLCTVCNENR